MNARTQSDVVIVSGLPRSGTSMMMRMIQAGGIAPLTDAQRTADEDNPLGYYELEAVKRTRDDGAWVQAARGRVVKVISVLLADLPAASGWTYRVVMMSRDLDEVLASQATMLARSGRPGARLTPEALKRAFTTQIEAVDRRLVARADVARLDVSYNRVMADPLAEAERVAGFLGLTEAAERMAASVDPRLYRNRTRG